MEFKVESTGEVQKVVMKDEVKDGTIRTSTPNNFRSGSSTRGNVKTGDAAPIIAVVLAMIIAAGVAVVMIWKRKRSGNNA